MKQRICDVCEKVTTPGTLIQLEGIFRERHPMGGETGRLRKLDLCSPDCLATAAFWLYANADGDRLPEKVTR
jgi:hypothetical protein